MLTGIVGEPSQILKYDCESWFRKTRSATDVIDSPISEEISRHWISIFEIDPICGVNLEEKRLDCKVGDFKLMYSLPTQIQQSREEDHRFYYKNTNIKKRICVLGSKLEVFIHMHGSEKKAVFVLSDCNCSVCQKPWIVKTGIKGANDWTFEFDTVSLKPVNMRLKFGHKEEVHDVELEFNPGVVNKFTMNEINHTYEKRSFAAVVYYCSVPLDSLTIMPFKDLVKRVQSVPSLNRVAEGNNLEKQMYSLEIEQIGLVHQIDSPEQKQLQQLQSTFKFIFENRAEDSDFVVLISNDEKIFRFQKSILCARSPVFKRMFANGNQEGTIKLEEDALATEVLVKFLYFQATGIEDLIFFGLVGTLNLAHRFGLMELVGTIANVMLGKMEDLEWKDVEALWKLYFFVKKANTLQTIIGLKLPCITALQRLHLAQMNKRVRKNEDAADESVNWAIGSYTNLAKDFALNVFQLS